MKLILILMMLVNSISASDVLKNLNIFLGTENGYELERQITRAEAAVILGRLYSFEGEYNHPFNDVPDWATNSIGFLYENDIAKGINNSEYGSSLLCSKEMFATLILRMLGVEEFEYEKSYDVLVSMGLAETSKELTRGNCVNILFRILMEKTIISGETKLIYYLRDKGIISNTQLELYVKEYTNNIVQEMNAYLQNPPTNFSFPTMLEIIFDNTLEDSYYKLTTDMLSTNIIKKGIYENIPLTENSTPEEIFESHPLFVDIKYIDTIYRTGNEFFVTLKGTFSTGYEFTGKMHLKVEDGLIVNYEQEIAVEGLNTSMIIKGDKLDSNLNLNQ